MEGERGMVVMLGGRNERRKEQLAQLGEQHAARVAGKQQPSREATTEPP
jgi:predicted RNA-binding protein Jag